MEPVTCEVLDKRFAACLRAGARLEHVHGKCRWVEGPAYVPATRSLIWSDIPNDRMLRLDEASGAVSIFRSPSSYSNGNTIDRQGRLVTCEQGARRVTRTERDGTITVLGDRFEGRRFNSPNDVVVGPDDSIWFTDPTYGLELTGGEPEMEGSHVYRIDAVTARVTRVLDDVEQPNGLAFSPDGRRLYVTDTGATHRPGGPRRIRVFDVASDGTLNGSAVFAELAVGLFDGLRLDHAARVWTSAGEAVHCYEPNGRLIGRIFVGETVANLAFGGPRRDMLYVCATTSLYRIPVATRGVSTF